MIDSTRQFKRARGAFLPAATLTLCALGAAPPAFAASAIAVAEYPLTIAVPAHPQVLIALGNSQSMDGDVSGAIWTGSGALGSTYSGLNATSSPVNYTVPTGFTAPVSNTAAGGSAPYTVTTLGVQYDNSASRLNVAKAGISSILSTFLQVADFGLMDYQTSGNSPQTTWVYYMSQPNTGFTFSNSNSSPPANTRYIANPCYGITATSLPVYTACQSMASRYSGLTGFQYMLISASSDDATISDVLYAGGLPPVFVEYNGPSPANPYSAYSLNQYATNFNSIQECYSGTQPATGFTFCETPTNAGFVPFTKEVMNVQRGFGFLTSGETAAPSSNTSWPTLVTMQTAGQSPTQTTINTVLAKFNPQLAAETNLTTTAEIKAQATQSPIAGLLTAAKDYYVAANPASSNGCAPNRYVVLVTDGLPTLDLSGKSWPPLGSAAALGYGVTASFNADNSLASTNSQALTDTISTLATLKSASIKTYIIALGAGVSQTGVVNQTLNAMAVAGGTNTVYSAQNPADLVTAMNQILVSILAETASTAAAAVNTNGINTKSVEYQARFNTSDTPFQDWTGDLLAFPINPLTGAINTATSAALWSSRTQLDAQDYSAGRLIATWDNVAGAGTPFRWNPNPSATTGIASSTALGQALQTFTADTSGQDVLNYLRGSSAQEKQNSGAFRNRSHKLADIVDSSPLYIAGPSGPWQSASYFAFESAYAGRQPLVYVGANDGMLHAFDAATGNEKFAFIPHGVWSNLIRLVSPFYNQQHWFYVDASPNAPDVQFSDGTWHTLLLDGEGAGGNSVFALDVTDPSKLSSEANVAAAALWEFTDVNLGLTYDLPTAVSTAAGFAIIFGNGYNSTLSAPFLYALNPKNGQSLIPGGLNLCLQVPTACNASLPNGLSGILAVNTSGLNSAASNIVYAGDLQGNLWRIDISNASPLLWTATVLFQARDSSGNPQPITTTPTASLNPLAPALKGVMVYFGTGQMLSAADLSNSQVQTIYGVFDSLSGSSTPLLRTNLVKQTMTSISVNNPSTGVATSLRQLSGNPVLLPSKSGWYVDLSLLAGERDVTSPIVFNGTVQVVTFQPAASQCASGGQAYLNVFSYATGGSTTLPQFDWTGSTSVGTQDLASNGSTISGMYLGPTYSSQIKVVSGGPSGATGYLNGGGAGGGGGGPPTCASPPCTPNIPQADPNKRGAWVEVR